LKFNLSLKDYFDGVGKYHLLAFFCCWLGGIFDGMDSTIMSVTLPVAIGELLGETTPEKIGSIGSWVTSLFLLGWTLGGFLFGYVSDRFGRIKAMVGSILLYSLFTGLAGLSENWWQLAACRFLTGLGIGGELVSITTFLTEVWPERSRAVAVGMLISSYQVGVFLSGILSYGFENWRHCFFVGALPAIIVIFMTLQLKESHKWEDSQKQVTEDIQVKDILIKHRHGLIIGSLAFGSLLIGYWASLSWIPSWIQSLMDGHGHLQRSQATIFQGCGAILGCISAGVFCSKLGRKVTLIIAFMGCLLSSILLFATNPVFSSKIYFECSLLGYFIGLCQSGLYVYLPELFPTLIRATGTGLCLNIGRFLTILAVLFIGTLVKVFGGYGGAALAFSASYLIGFVTLFFGRETKDKPLDADFHSAL
jgi:MFS family permease